MYGFSVSLIERISSGTLGLTARRAAKFVSTKCLYEERGIKIIIKVKKKGVNRLVSPFVIEDFVCEE